MLSQRHQPRFLDDVTVRIIRIHGDDHSTPFEGTVFSSRQDEPLIVVTGTFNGVIDAVADYLTGGVDADFGVSSVW